MLAVAYSRWFLILLLPSHIPVLAENVCVNIYGENYVTYSRLYLKLEETLIKYHKEMLEQLRVVFSSSEGVQIYFNVNLKVVNGTNLFHSCDSLGEGVDLAADAFCQFNSSAYMWNLCHSAVSMSFTTQWPYAQDIDIDFISWMSYLHGGVLSTLFTIGSIYYYGMNELEVYGEGGGIDITLQMDTPDCNPSLPLMKCVLSELFSWVS